MSDRYQQEAERKWGDSKEYRESRRRTSRYTEQDWEKIREEEAEIYALFFSLKNEPLNAVVVEHVVRRWQAHISRYYYECTDQILAGLGMIYETDQRFSQTIDRHGDGTAKMMSTAIRMVVQREE